MALKVWLPLNGNLENKGISNITITNNGATIDNNGKIGKCYSFNGNYIKTNYSNYPNIFSGDFSICFGVYSTTNKARDIYFANFGLSGSGNGFNLERDANNYLRFGWANGSPDYHNSNFVINQNEGTHISVIKSENTLIFYKNGNLINSYTTTLSTAIPLTATTFYLGADYRTGQSIDLYGKINDFRIYDHCLSAKEVKEISQGLVLHYKLDGFSGGAGENLAFAPTTATNFGSSNELRTITFSGWDAYAPLNLNLTAAEGNTMVGQKITYSCGMKNIEQTAGTGTGIMLHVRYVDGTYQQYGGGKNGTSGSYLAQGESGGLKLTITIPDPTARTNPTTISHVQFSIRHNSSSGASTVQYQYAKVEKGNQQTAGSPAPSEIGIDTTKIKDSSGYENDGIQNNIITSLDTPRYLISSQFNGTDSYIKVSNNNGMVQGMEALTINFGAKATTGPTNGGRLLSCTETGGFNLEGGSSGYGRFPIHVYTNAEKTSTAYKYDSKEIQISALIPDNGNMITLVYDTTGTKTYINGQLHHTYTNTSYGIHFNTNARLFLGCEANTASPGGNYFNGQESDFRLYVTALSAEDIATLYHTPAQVNNLGGVHGFEFIEKTPNLLNPDLRGGFKESNVTCVGNEETKYFDVNTNRDTSVTSRGGIFQNITVKPNTSYLFAVDMMGTGSAMGISAQDTTATWPSDRNIAGDTKRYYYILTTTATNTVGRVYLNTKPSTNQIAHFKNIYLGEIDEIASIKQNGIFENEHMVEYNENGRITKSGELAGSNFIEK